MFYGYIFSDVRVLEDVKIKFLSMNYVLCFIFLLGSIVPCPLLRAVPQSWCIFESLLLLLEL
jgi:hypothetical protein